MTTRRSFLALFAMNPFGITACSTGSLGANGAMQNSQSAKLEGSALTSNEALDEALEMLAPYGPSYRGGLSSHGPMAAEALVAMGRHDAVLAWVDKYRKRLEARPASVSRIAKDHWRDALGKSAQTRDWVEFFTNELAESSWQTVIGVWIPRLAPGLAAAALHGVIRVGHAVCSLKAIVTPVRIDELARALGYLAAEFLTLPGEFAGAGTLSPQAAVGQLELLPNSKRTTNGLISSELADLGGFVPFEGAVNLVQPMAGTPNFMSELVATFAGVFAAVESKSFEFLHAVTGSAAVAELLPYIPVEEHARIHAYTWQVVAGIFVRYATPNLVVPTPDSIAVAKATDADIDRLARLASDGGDAHTIKLVCTSIREWRRNPDPRFLAAAEDRVS
jgi:hypothetical protein